MVHPAQSVRDSLIFQSGISRRLGTSLGELTRTDEWPGDVHFLLAPQPGGPVS